MTLSARKKETRTKEDRTAVQTVIQQLAFWTSESDGGNGFSIISLKEGGLVVKPALLISLTAKVTTALMQHSEAEEDESNAASYIVDVWLTNVAFIRRKADLISKERTMWGVFDALDEENEKSFINSLYSDCHRRAAAAEFLLRYWEDQKKTFRYLTT